MRTFAINEQKGNHMFDLVSSKEEVRKRKTKVLFDSEEDAKFTWIF